MRSITHRAVASQAVLAALALGAPGLALAADIDGSTLSAW